ncbi:glycosyltransferase [Limosilactobacillus vaginalis]|uniref:glycosyltransferase n=1 Tax=Limosilactobacillus vaginalis TaxID=1633 RepID=UPI0025A40BFF|nr:glycosyltransferase [Limosilactobacillus vaginalis]MDM8260096.1 glycosyltransferase [Limosilactobacillus vaginalis]
MIKVLHVFNQFNQGGIEHVVINLMNNMDLSKVEFHFAIMSGKPGLLDEKVKKMGGKIHYFTSGRKSIFNIKANMNRIINEFGPFKVVHSHVYFSSGYILKLAYKDNVPTRIAHVHDVYKGEKINIKRKLYETLMRSYINRYSTLKFGVSKEACMHVFGMIDNKTFIINNGIDIEKYKFDFNLRKAKRSAFNISSETFVIINIGRFEDQKDHSYLVDIFSKILNNYPNSKLMLVGNGSLKNKIVEKCKNLGILDKILFLENRKDVNELLMCADIFIMPSKYEGLPVSLIEAQASGIPCIVSNSITDKAVIAPNVISIDKSKKELWVTEALKLKNHSHINNYDLLNKKGFNIKEIALFVQNMYLR